VHSYEMKYYHLDIRYPSFPILSEAHTYGPKGVMRWGMHEPEQLRKILRQNCLPPARAASATSYSSFHHSTCFCRLFSDEAAGSEGGQRHSRQGAGVPDHHQRQVLPALHLHGDPAHHGVVRPRRSAPLRRLSPNEYQHPGI